MFHLPLLVSTWIGLCASFPAANLVDDEADARAIVDKATKAMGGEEKLAKFAAQTWKETGTYYGMGAGLPYVGNYSVQWPSKFKMEILGVFTLALNGDKGWVQDGGEIRDMSGEEVKVQQEGLYASWVSSLLPLKDKKFKLATVGESKVNGSAVVGVRVSSEGRRDVNLYFDKTNYLLLKVEHRAIASEQGGKEVNQETVFTDYKDIEGVKSAGKFVMTRDGEKYIESETSELKPAGKLDDSVFAKPQ
jgi:hypothetical protein